MPSMRKRGVVRVGTIGRKILSFCGQIEVRRPRYRCRSCGNSCYGSHSFFDTLGSRRISEKALEFALQLALYVPYEQVS